MIHFGGNGGEKEHLCSTGIDLIKDVVRVVNFLYFANLPLPILKRKMPPGDRGRKKMKINIQTDQ